MAEYKGRVLLSFIVLCVCVDEKEMQAVAPA